MIITIEIIPPNGSFEYAEAIIKKSANLSLMKLSKKFALKLKTFIKSKLHFTKTLKGGEEVDTKNKTAQDILKYLDDFTCEKTAVILGIVKFELTKKLIRD